jgi:hypothetical protein
MAATLAHSLEAVAFGDLERGFARQRPEPRR